MKRSTGFVVLLLVAAPAWAQLTVPITSFEANRDGDALVTGIPGYNSIYEVFFQDPAINATTTAQVLAKNDWAAIGCQGCPSLDCNQCVLPDFSLEETFVSDFVGGSDGFYSSLMFFSWANPADADRWVRVTTRNPPIFPAPTIHLGGKVRMQMLIEDAGFGDSNLTLGFALLVRETNSIRPLGFNGGNVGPLEFVGLSNLLNADSNGPTPVPSAGLTFSGPSLGTWFTVEFDLATLPKHGWTAEGGNGVLEGTKGVFESLIIMAESGGRDVFIAIDEIEFVAPPGYQDPTIAPRIGVPVVETQSEIKVNDLITSATQVSVQVDRAYDGVTFVADETYNLDIPGDETYATVPGIPALAIGDAVRAFQTAPSGVSDFSAIVEVTPPPAFTVSITLDETGNGSQTLNFEYVGATSISGTAAPQGKSVFAACGTWQNYEFDLTGLDPVLNFAGGDGVLDPSPTGNYSFDALWFTINNIAPDVGPYRVLVDQLYYVSAADAKVVLNDAEILNHFSGRRANPPAPASFSFGLTTEASVDGQQSAFVEWQYPDTDLDNSLAAYRLFPGFPFPDTAKKLGVWILVEDCSTNGPARPVLPTRIVGNPPAVSVGGLDGANLVSVELYVNGTLDSTVTTTGVTSVAVDPVATLVVGDIINATQTTNAGTSPLSLPRGVSPPAAPSVPALLQGQTSVTVNDVSAAPNAVATLVKVFANNVQIGSAAGGTSTVIVTVNPALVAGQSITATQVVNALESAPSPAIVVGTGVIRKVVINEVQYDDVPAGGADAREFVELYNADTNAIDISGWTLRASDTVAPPADNNPDYEIPDNTILAAGDYYVIGDAGIPNLDLEVTSTNTEGLWENANEAIELLDEIGVVVDSMAYEINKGPVAVAVEGGGLWGNLVSEATQVVLARTLDGYDTGNNGRDFVTRRATPGTSNSVSTQSIYLGPDVDSATVGTDLPNFHGSFVNPRIADPTIVDAINLIAVAPSPQGGNCAVFWDPSGGGNTSGSNFTMGPNSGYDLWVYVDGGLATTNTEEWNIGIAGTADYWAQNGLSGTANGSTGVSWIFQRGTTAASLRLVDHGDGGPPAQWTTYGSIDTSTLASGWYRLAIYLCGDRVTGIFDTTTVKGRTTANIIGNFYVGFREDGAGVANVHGPRLDMRVPTGDCQPNGTADALDIANGTSKDCNCTLVPDECETIAAGDYDADADVDLVDYEGLADCLDGPGTTPATPVSGCDTACLAAFDDDSDGDIDLMDFAAFQQLLP